MVCNLIVHFLIDLRCSAWLWVGCSPAKKKKTVIASWFDSQYLVHLVHCLCTFSRCYNMFPSQQNLGNGMCTTIPNKHSTSTRHPAPSTHWYPVRPVVHDMPQGLAIKPKSQDSFRERKHAFDLFINMHKPQWSTKNASQVSCGREELFCYEAPPPAPLKQKQEIMEALACLRRYKAVHRWSWWNGHIRP